MGLLKGAVGREEALSWCMRKRVRCLVLLLLGRWRLWTLRRREEEGRWEGIAWMEDGMRWGIQVGTCWIASLEFVALKLGYYFNETWFRLLIR